MPNLDSPFGLRWVGSSTGASSPVVEEFEISVNNSEDLVAGMVVEKAPGALGYLAQTTFIPERLAYVVTQLFDVDGKPVKRLPANTVAKATGIPLKGQFFAVQVDAAIAEANIGDVGDLIQVPPNSFDVAQTEISSSSVGTGTQFRVMGLVKESNNEWDDNANIIVASVQNLWENQTSA